MTTYSGKCNKLKRAVKKAQEDLELFEKTSEILDMSSKGDNPELEALQSLIFIYFEDIILEESFYAKTGIRTFIVMHSPDKLAGVLRLFLTRKLIDSNFKSNLQVVADALEDSYIQDKPLPIEFTDLLKLTDEDATC